MMEIRDLTSFPNNLHAIIFDMDGTLLDTEKIYKTAIYDTAEAFGRTMTTELHLSMVGAPKELSDQILGDAYGHDFNVHKFRVAYHKRYEKLCEEGVPKKRGTDEILDWLIQKNIPVAIATSTSREMAVKHLKSAGIYDQIDTLVTRTDVNKGKPFPDSYLLACQRLAVATECSIAVEDSYNGIRSAVSAGLAAVFIPDMLERNEEMEQNTVSIHDNLLYLLQCLKQTYD